MRLSPAIACSLFASRPKRGLAQVGMGNPATLNCINQNFTDQTLYAPNGDQYGLCIFSNTTACNDWAFERGTCDTTNPNFSVYCADNEGEVSQENVDWGAVEGAPPATYGMCTSNGKQCTEYDYYAYNNCSFVDDTMLGQPTNGCMGSPDGCYCSDNGYIMSPTLYEPTGGEYALCVFSNETACDSWAYFRGECDTSNPNFQVYCEENGGELSKDSVDWGEVEGAPPAEYEVCTISGVECTENEYYTTGCTGLTVPTESVGEGLSATKVPKGESAEIDCPEGSFCCMEGSFGSLSNSGVMVIGGDSSCGGNIKVTSGVATDCGSDDCVISCTGLCDVKVVGGTGVVETPTNLGQPPVGVLDSTPSAADDVMLGQPTNGCMGSPDGCYCSDNGYSMSPTLYEPTGGEYALCVFSNETACDSWAYVRGECDTSNPNFQVYCEENGGELSKDSVDWGEVEGAPPAEYEVCTTSGVECTENEYYTTGCTDLTVPTESVGEGPTGVVETPPDLGQPPVGVLDSTPSESSESNVLRHGQGVVLAIISLQIFAALV